MACPFEFHQPVFKKVTSAGLNSLQQKEYQITFGHSEKAIEMCPIFHLQFDDTK